MTGALLERPSLFAERHVLDGGGTLEELLGSALDEARANGSTECPVCHGPMTVRHGAMTVRHGATSSARAGAREAVPAAECGSCGSRLT
jgi:hypothetical protein